MIVTIITVSCRQSVTIYIALSGTISLLITSLMEKYSQPSTYAICLYHSSPAFAMVEYKKVGDKNMVSRSLQSG